MATLEQLESALIKADAAGNTDDARVFANEIRRLRAETTQPEVNQPVQEPVQPQEKGLIEKGVDAITPWYLKPELDDQTQADKTEMFNNIPKSAGELAKGVFNMAGHPIDTLKSVWDIEQGLAEKAIPGDYSTDKTQMVDQIGQALKDRYGGIDNLRNTSKTDPVGALLDTVGVASGGGTLAAKGANLAAKAIPKNLPKNMLSDALRMRPGVAPAEKGRIVETLLKEGIKPTEKGIEKASNIVRELNSKIDDLIKSAPEGTKFDRDYVLKYIDDIKEEYGGKFVEGGDDLNTVDRIVDDFKTHMDTIKTGDHFTPEELQAFKKNIYKKINWKNADQSLVKNDTYLAQAKAAREGIETLSPEIKVTNQREGAIIEALKELPSLTNKMANYRTVGMDAGLKTMIGTAIDPGLGTAAGVTAGTLGHARVKSNLAYIIDALKKTAPQSQAVTDALKPILAGSGLLELNNAQ